MNYPEGRAFLLKNGDFDLVYLLSIFRFLGFLS